MINMRPATSLSPLRSAYTVRRLEAAQKFGVVDRIERLPSINLSLTVWSEISKLMLAGEDAIHGFSGGEDYEDALNVLLSGNPVQMIRPLLMISDDEGEDLNVRTEVILRDLDGKNIALMHLTEKFRIDIEPLKLIAPRDEELVPLIREYLLYGYDLAIAGDIDVVTVEKDALSALPVAGESEQAAKRSRG